VIYIENEGALFRGPARAWPREVFAGGQWAPYEGQTPKDVEWGNEIDEAEAQRLMGGQGQQGGQEAQPAQQAPA
jgi:hypothetical protein